MNMSDASVCLCVNVCPDAQGGGSDIDDSFQLMIIIVSAVSHLCSSVCRYVESGTGLGYYEVCDGSGEDPQCSFGTLLSAEITDHLSYLDHAVCGCKPF